MAGIGDGKKPEPLGRIKINPKCIFKQPKKRKAYWFERRHLEEELVSQMKQDGSVIQRQEARTFNPENAGSNPAGPTNQLVAKKCTKCNQAMHIHKTDTNIVFSGCEPCITDISLERLNDNEMVIKAKRSTKRVRCHNCKSVHMLRTFEEVKDGSK